jgi:H+/Cl- antiporter ClcA
MVRSVNLIRWIAIGAVVGALAGVSSALLLETLDRATELRGDHAWLLWLLPVAGCAVAVVYHYAGGDSARGNDLILDEIHSDSAWVPRRMAPLIFVATAASHLFGASVGREGTAVQMSGSLADGWLNRVLGLRCDARRTLLITAIAGGFGAVFGVPVAGCVFALEVQAAGRIRHDAIVPALTASVLGDRIVAALGVEHAIVAPLSGVDLDLRLAAELVLAGVAFGLAARLFVAAVHALKALLRRSVAWPPARPLVGGAAVIGLTYAVGTRDYLGLSLPLAAAAVAGSVATFAFAWKLLFSTVSLGSGFFGGEVTPLFVIGATLGATLGDAFGGDPVLFAAVGYAAVFGAAANTPIACVVLGIELFGAAAIVPLAIGCVVAYAASLGSGIYAAQPQPGSALRQSRVPSRGDGAG